MIGSEVYKVLEPWPHTGDFAWNAVYAIYI